ncbi:MAG: chemotaxis protein CheW [Pirellulaceae bacterium]|nr:chemotaxis protein CheW [Pirellulaceae bacterium]
MLLLMCQAGANRYAIDTRSVVEVVACVDFQPVPDAPAWLAGVFAYRGRAIPLVDLTRLLSGQPCPRRANSRIILVRCAVECVPETIGLLAERVTIAETELPATGAGGPARHEARGPILFDRSGMFQLLDLTRLLPAYQAAGSDH